MAQTINARVQFSTASLADWEKINPQLKEGELVLAKLDSGKYRLIVGAIGGSKLKDSVLVWDEVDAETLLANTEKASAAASASASAAKTSETNAKASETAAKTSETNAKASETASKTSETNAKASETASKTAEANAKISATNAATSESNAKSSETASASSAKAADTSAQNAAGSSASAGSFASQAGDSAKAASTSAGNASTSETNAVASASDAKNSASSASVSASKASTSETNAKASETAAKTSETNAKASENASATSAKASADSASAAKTSETNAKASETASKTSETNAKASETNAAKSAEEAAASAKAAAEHDPSELIAQAHHYIKRNTAYKVGDVLTSPNLPYGTIIVVTQAGTTGADEPDWATIKNNMGGVTDDGTLKFKTESMFQQVLKDAILAAHPVGSIYESTDSTSPEVLFGGTWETMEAGRVLVSAGTASTGTVYSSGAKGGEESTGISIDNLPPHSFSGTTSWAGDHNHNMSLPQRHGGDGTNTGGAAYFSNGDTGKSSGGNGVGWTSNAGGHNHTFTTNTLGSGVKHNNMQPYEVIHRWKRTA